MIRNTFLLDFVPVPGMATLYSRWQELNQKHSTLVHYVSASPWQLFPSLSGFLEASDFPMGLFTMKTIRWKDTSILNLLPGKNYKVNAIAELITRHPKRQYVLVGDAGEKDPEAYGDVARRFPDNVRCIFIRNITTCSSKLPWEERYAKAFAGVRAPWMLFSTGDDLTHVNIETDYCGLAMKDGSPSAISLGVDDRLAAE